MTIITMCPLQCARSNMQTAGTTPMTACNLLPTERTWYNSFVTCIEPGHRSTHVQHQSPLVHPHSMGLLLTALRTLWVVSLCNRLIYTQHALQVQAPALPSSGDFGLEVSGSWLGRHAQGCLDLRLHLSCQLFAAAKDHFVGWHVIANRFAFSPSAVVATISANSKCKSW